MDVNLRAVAVNMFVKNTLMFVDVGVHNSDSDVVVNGCKPVGDPLRDASEIKYSKENQHKTYS